jgi:hypothetical protein
VSVSRYATQPDYSDKGDVGGIRVLSECEVWEVKVTGVWCDFNLLEVVYDLISHRLSPGLASRLV